VDAAEAAGEDDSQSNERYGLKAASFRAETDAEAADCYSRLAEAYQAEGQPHQAMAAYSRALEFDPGNRRAAQGLAELGG